MISQQTQRDGLECFGRSRNLCEDFNAIVLLLDHPLQTTGLPVAGSKTFEVVIFVDDVADGVRRPSNLSVAIDDPAAPAI